MKLKCSYKDCQEDWDENQPVCLCGEVDYKKCQNYVYTQETGNTQDVDEIKKNLAYTLPWNGSAMGSLDTQFLTIKRPPTVIGVVGHSKTGKTTLLACLYMLLRNGKKIDGYEFCGSYTLIGWEKISHFLKLNSNKKLSFPPHTSANMNRVPGLLHLKLKDIHGIIQDVLFTDAPGEWFSEWAKTADSETGKGARWIDENADAYILIADTNSFKENTGSARHALMQIIERIKNTHNKRPTALIWTKSDVDIEGFIKERITSQVKSHLPDIDDYNVAVINRSSENDLDNILSAISNLLKNKSSRLNNIADIEPKDNEDFFFNLRR
jgi:hypothetical protein